MVWSGGTISFGPTFTANDTSEALTPAYPVTRDTAAQAINEALRHLGVRTTGEEDEFSAIGLDRYRWTDEWAAVSTPPTT